MATIICPGCCYPCAPSQFKSATGRRHKECRLCRAKRRYREATDELRLETVARDMAQHEYRESREREEAICH